MTEIEGTVINVCKECSGYGKVIKPIVQTEFKGKARKAKKTSEDVIYTETEQDSQSELIESIVENYNEIIKRKREKLGMPQKEFARHVNEKESLMQNIEKGRMEPSMSLAKKLEKLLDITLIEMIEDSGRAGIRSDEGDEKSATFTLGDFIKKR